MKYLSALLIGALFGCGIAVSGMINPAKVLNFFDIAGTWDPSLAFVMAGALAVAIPGYAVVFRKRRGPVLEPEFSMPTKTAIDARLILGSAAFGIGWGIAGFCPGAAIPAMALWNSGTLIFLAAMIAGMLAARVVDSVRLGRAIEA